MHLVGFAIKIYYDARPYERQTRRMYFLLSRNEFLNIIHRSSNLPTSTYVWFPNGIMFTFDQSVIFLTASWSLHLLLLK